MLGWLKEEPTDWSDVERLEQRIRDIRERIRKAKGTQEQLLPPSRLDIRAPATSTVEELRLKSFNARASLGEGPKVSPESGYSTGEAEAIKRKLLGLD
tara:strand:- start:93 stop:386 length:294 start_codon:yes stop_codon:yes gene_type:complete